MKLPKEAIWLMLLGAVLLLLISKMHGETPRHYAKRTERRLTNVILRLAEFSERPVNQADDVYIVRADMDIELALRGLRDYKQRAIPKAEMERLMKQLDRDMEDYPPQEAKR